MDPGPTSVCLRPGTGGLGFYGQWDGEIHDLLHLLLQEGLHLGRGLLRALDNQLVMDLKNQLCLRAFLRPSSGWKV